MDEIVGSVAGSVLLFVFVFGGAILTLLWMLLIEEWRRDHPHKRGH